MIGSIIVGICITALVVAMLYGVYMAYWGVWNEHRQIKTNNIFRNNFLRDRYMVFYYNVSDNNNIKYNRQQYYIGIIFKISRKDFQIIMTRQELLNRLERIADSMDMDMLNRQEIEAIVDDIKTLQWDVNTQGIKIEID